MRIAIEIHLIINALIVGVAWDDLYYDYFKGQNNIVKIVFILIMMVGLLFGLEMVLTTATIGTLKQLWNKTTVKFYYDFYFTKEFDDISESYKNVLLKTLTAATAIEDKSYSDKQLIKAIRKILKRNKNHYLK